MDHVIVEIQDPVGRVVLNRPERRNAMSLAMLEEIEAALAALASDSRVRAIVVEGAGKAFSAGHDLAEMLDRTPQFYDELFRACTRAMQAIHRTPQPVIAQVHGVATAAGCQLAASCDLVVAADDARFGTPGVKIGLFCTTPMVPVTRAIGRKRAMEMLLTGDTIDAPTAMAWGLVNRVSPAGELREAVLDLVDSITRYSGAVIADGKHAFYRQVGLDEDEAYQVTEPLMATAAATPHAQEGFAAFLEKRRPVWSDGVS
ncbi:MAG TPA: enoyl-CoA hydratase [Acidimicrobiia bacterium]|jgi:enoyl-CoA hydratase/carnithine racemase